MFDGLIINKLLEENRVTKVDLYKHIGISKKSLDDIINGTHMPRINNVESIADFFKVPIDYLFDRNIKMPGINIGHQVKGNGNNISGDISLSECQKEVIHLKELLYEKERTIQILIEKQ